MSVLRMGPVILSTDLDGTLLGRGVYQIGNALPQKLLDLHDRLDVIWMINTGRRYQQLLDLVQRAGLVRLPDYLVERETFLYRYEAGDYVPVADWNDVMRERVEAVLGAVAPRVVQWGERIAERFPGVRIRLDSGIPLSVQCTDAGQSSAVRDLLREWTSRIPGAAVMRNGIWVGVWVAGCDKGTVLAYVSKRHGVPPSRIMAVGDSENDLPMLAASVAGFPVAPDNAEPMVKEFVAAQGGYVSPHPDIDGVLDGLERFLAPWLRGGIVDA